MWVRTEPEADSLKWYTGERQLLGGSDGFQLGLWRKNKYTSSKCITAGWSRKDGDANNKTKPDDLTIPEKKTKGGTTLITCQDLNTQPRRVVASVLVSLVSSCLVYCLIYVDYKEYRFIVNFFFCALEWKEWCSMLNEKACYYVCLFSCLVKENEFN